MNQPTATLTAPDLQRFRLRELSALGELFWLTLRQHTRGRRWLVLVLLYALPCGLAILLRSLARQAPTDALETSLVFYILPHALGPLTALLYAGGLIQDEVEEQTLTYLLLRPLPRWGIYLSRLFATMLTTIVLVCSFTIILYACIYWNAPDQWAEVFPGRALKTAALMALAQVAYCSLFGCVGLLIRRSLIFGVVYIFAAEGLLSNLDFVGRALTVVYYIRILAVRWLGFPEDMLDRFQRQWSLRDLGVVPGAAECVRTLLVASFVLTLIATWWFTRKEFRMKTPEGS